MTPPKVVFKLPTTKQEAQLFMWFCLDTEDSYWIKMIYNAHPKVKTIIRNNKDEKKLYKELYAYSKSFIAERKAGIEKCVREYQKEWDKVNDTYLKMLSKDFETGYPKGRRTMTAYISIFPVCPRFLDTWSFNVQYAQPELMKPVVAHEILHFMYFKKWMEVFPKTKRREMEAPHLVWKLSEILAPIILRNNLEMQALIRSRDRGYIKGFNRHFTKLYKNHLKTKSSFEDFLKASLEEAQKQKI